MSSRKLETLERCILCEGAEIGPLCQQNRFFECGSCGLVFDNPRPTAASIREFYSRGDKYDGWLDQEEERDRLWRRRLERVQHHRTRGRLLDVGTGTGQFLSVAHPDFEVFGTEISESAVQIARDKYGLRLHHGTLEGFEADRLFDVVTIFHVLEHVPHPGELLDQVKRLLAPGGLVVVAVPNEVEGVRFLLKRWRGLGPIGVPALSMDGSLEEIHLAHFTRGVLSSHLESRGFRVEEDSVDPYYVASGWKKSLHRGFYRGCHLADRLFGRNLYDTIWMVARKGERDL